MKIFIGAILTIFTLTSNAGSIGFGEVVAVKIYDLSSFKGVKIYLDSSATHTDEDCTENGRVYRRVSLGQQNEATTNRIVSLATAAYMAGKKLRLHSDANSCEIDFVALQESVF